MFKHILLQCLLSLVSAQLQYSLGIEHPFLLTQSQYKINHINSDYRYYNFVCFDAPFVRVYNQSF